MFDAIINFVWTLPFSGNNTGIILIGLGLLFLIFCRFLCYKIEHSNFIFKKILGCILLVSGVVGPFLLIFNYAMPEYNNHIVKNSIFNNETNLIYENYYLKDGEIYEKKQEIYEEYKTVKNGVNTTNDVEVYKLERKLVEETYTSFEKFAYAKCPTFDSLKECVQRLKTVDISKLAEKQKSEYVEL